MTPLAARILEGRPQEERERLPGKVNVHEDFPEHLSQRGPDTFIAKAASPSWLRGLKEGRCGPELSRPESSRSLLPECTAWLSNPHGLWPRSLGPSLHQLRWLPLALEMGCAPANGLQGLSLAGPDSQEVLREAEVWRDNTGCSLTPGI